MTVRDLTLVAEIPGAGTALELFSPARGVRNYRTLTVENVDIRGAGLPTRSYFKRGLAAIGQWRPLFRNLIFCGVLIRLSMTRRSVTPSCVSSPNGDSAPTGVTRRCSSIVLLVLPHGLPHRLARPQTRGTGGCRLPPLHRGGHENRH